MTQIVCTLTAEQFEWAEQEARKRRRQTGQVATWQQVVREVLDAYIQSQKTKE